VDAIEQEIVSENILCGSRWNEVNVHGTKNKANTAIHQYS